MSIHFDSASHNPIHTSTEIFAESLLIFSIHIHVHIMLSMCRFSPQHTSFHPTLFLVPPPLSYPLLSLPSQRTIQFLRHTPFLSKNNSNSHTPVLPCSLHSLSFPIQFPFSPCTQHPIQFFGTHFSSTHLLFYEILSIHTTSQSFFL